MTKKMPTDQVGDVSAGGSARQGNESKGKITTTTPPVLKPANLGTGGENHSLPLSREASQISVRIFKRASMKM